jgi:hypothetical protein
MTFAHALPLLAIALGQAAPPAPDAPPPAEAQEQLLPPPRLVPVSRPDAAPLPLMKVAEGSPVLRFDAPTGCLARNVGGRWRAQCDKAAKRCLFAPDAELSAEGEPVASLDRVPACAAPGWREDDLVSEGFELVPALAETPAGWHRDDRQRLMQVNFDLNRRIWLGAGYAAGGLPGSGTGEATAGIRWDIPFRLARAPALARLRAFETYASFDGSFVDFTVAGIDASRAYPSPLVRITTFVGKPRRFDPPLYLGFWLEAVRAETIRTEAGWYDRTEIGAAALTLDLWRSRDLASFVRLRGGAGIELADQLAGSAWVPHAALDADVSLDRDGFHHLRLTAMQEWLVTSASTDYQPSDPASPRLPAHRARLTGKAEYELILLAVNDQPLSAVLDVRGWKRNDVPGFSTDWAVQGTASVRFNLWAPPRRDARAQEKL